MSITRFYSLGLGKAKNFSARTDGLISAGDTTPDVSLNSLLYVDTAGSLAITNFDNGEEGQLVSIINLGAGEVTFSNRIYASDSSALSTNDTAVFIYHNSAWYEVTRSHNTFSEQVTVAASGDSSPSVKNASLLVLSTTAKLTITAFDDGYDGQTIKVLKVNSCYNTISNGGTIMIADTAGNFLLNNSAVVEFFRYGGVWYATGNATTGIA